MDFVSAGDLSAAFGLMKGTFTRSKTVNVVLPANNWSTAGGEVSHTFGAPGATKGALVIVGLSESATREQRDACRKALLQPRLLQDGVMRLYADGGQPKADLPITVMIFY